MNFSRGVEGPLSQIPKGAGGRKYPAKMENPERWVGGGGGPK